MLRGILLISVFSLSAAAQAAQFRDLEFQLYFKAFCKNDVKEVEVVEKNEPIVYHLKINDDGSTDFEKAQTYHYLNSAGYVVYVSLEILRESGGDKFHIRLTPWRRVNDRRDISYGTAFVEQAEPSPIPTLGLAVNEEINESTGSYCTLTATIASK